jgi:hypothetical protein
MMVSWERPSRSTYFEILKINASEVFQPKTAKAVSFWEDFLGKDAPDGGKCGHLAGIWLQRNPN